MNLSKAIQAKQLERRNHINSSFTNREDLLEKGTYADTTENRKLGRVGQKYGRREGLEKESESDLPKGTKVIGTTKSGKKVYSKKVVGNTKNFTKEDHKEALQFHYSIYSKMHPTQQNSKKYKYHKSEASHHSDHARSDQESSSKDSYGSIKRMTPTKHTM